MKIIDRISLTVFSVIILAISLVTCFIISGWLEVEVITNLTTKIITNRVGTIVTLILSIIFTLMSLKCIFFSSHSKEKSKEGILLENENGKLLVSKDTIENLSTSVIKNYDSIENSHTRVEVDAENKITVFITLEVYSEAIIKELAAKLQKEIKEEVKKSLDLEIKEVNIRIKNINAKKENVVKE